MRLNQYVAEKRLAIFDDLKKGLPPREGVFDAHVLAEAKVKGVPQMGATRYTPDAVHIEFIYPDAATSAAVVTVTLTPPERIVFMPVPGWVVESIWQGEIDGSYHFESDAYALLRGFEEGLSASRNGELFGHRMATGRS
jgi:hypothetical protein